MTMMNVIIGIIKENKDIKSKYYKMRPSYELRDKDIKI